MIVQLSGTVVRAGATDFVIDCGGVGYGAQTTPATAAALRVGEQALVHTSMVVREDSQTLYGFSAPEERDAFELVQTASGVGPRLAVAIVSVLGVSELKQAIRSEDLARLCTVPGIGRKSAQKLVIELKDKVLALGEDGAGQSPPPTSSEQWREQVSEGLQSLGWSARDAGNAVDNVAHLAEDRPGISIGELMRAALGSLARKP